MTRKLAVFSYQPVSLCVMWEPQAVTKLELSVGERFLARENDEPDNFQSATLTPWQKQCCGGSPDRTTGEQQRMGK